MFEYEEHEESLLQDPEDSNQRIIGILFSIGVHLLVMIFLYRRQQSLEETMKQEAEVKRAREGIELTYVPQERAQKILEQQIVNNENTGKEQVPQNSQFMGEKNQVFEKQTVAKKVGFFNKGGGGEKAKSQQREMKKKSSLPIPQDETVGVGPKKKITLKDLAQVGSLSEEELSQRVGSSGTTGEGKGEAQNNDFIMGVEGGDATHLNTHEFKYYGFYFRIRQKLEQFWGNSLEEKAKILYMQGRRLANKNHITSLSVIINGRGEVIKVIINGSSGVKELDDAATESFRRAGPFPNPPSGMLKDGQAEIRWSFVVRT